VRYWSDFSRAYFHPRSAVELTEYRLDGSGAIAGGGFDTFASGAALFRDLDAAHDLLDRDVRPFVEEADGMQGIQLVTGADDGWGGFAAAFLERLRDEYGKTALWTWALRAPQAGIVREKRLARLANEAQAAVEAYRQSTLFMPVCAPASLPRSVVLDGSSAWHASALVATALESVTLPSRLRDPANRDTLGGMAELLNVMGKQTIAGLRMSVPGEPAPPPTLPADDEDGTEEEASELRINFDPPDPLPAAKANGHRPTHTFARALTLRGYPVPTDTEAQLHAAEALRQRHARRVVTRRYHTRLEFPQPDSFPSVYRDDDGDPRTGALSVRASLSTDSGVSDRWRAIRRAVVRAIGVEDREALGNDLAEMADEYHEGWSSGSDEGEDD
jgi:hypothetical protein